MTTATKITITLSDRNPITIDTAAWPVIARARAWNGEHEFQANRIDWIRVRQHADGRMIVSGGHEAGNGGMCAGEREIYAGQLLDAGGDVVRAIRRVAGSIERDDLAQECIADLPAEDLD